MRLIYNSKEVFYTSALLCLPVSTDDRSDNMGAAERHAGTAATDALLW